MRAIILIITLLSFALQTIAQQTIEGLVIDAKSKKAIPYVNIGIKVLAKGTLSDFEGKYALETSSKDDIITFSSIGYETVNIKVDELKPYDTLQLLQTDYQLEMVEIEAKRFEEKEVILGAKSKNRGHSIGFGSAQLGAEIGAKIEVKHPTYIQSVNFELNHAKGDSLLFRVNIYDLTDGKIGSNLMMKNILVKEKQRTGTITVDLSQYNLILHSDVLLSLEWLRNFDEIGNKELTFNTRKSKSMRGVYLKYSSNGEFEKLSHKTKLKPCFYFTGKQSK